MVMVPAGQHVERVIEDEIERHRRPLRAAPDPHAAMTSL